MIAMTARATSGHTVEILRVGTPVRYLRVDRLHHGTISRHIWQGDQFWHYEVDGEPVYYGAILRHP